MKHEIKQQFDAYGADLGDLMGLSERSATVTTKSKKKQKKTSGGLLRKMSMKLSQGLGDFLNKANSISNESAGKGDSSKGSKKKSLKKTASVVDDAMNSSMLTRGDSSMKNKRSSNATIKKGDSIAMEEDQPVQIEWTTDVARPHEDASFDTEFLEMSIEKKR